MRVIEDGNLGSLTLMSRAAAGVSRQSRAMSKPWAQRPNTACLMQPTRAVRSTPTVLCGRGSSGLPCTVSEVVSGSGLGALGASWWGSSAISDLACPELQDVLSSMGRSLAEAKRVGATGMSVQDAQAFYDKESSWWDGSNPFAPQKCRDLANDGRVRLDALNRAVTSAGGQAAAPPAADGSGGPGDGGFFGTWMSTLKTVAIAGAVIAGVVVVAPIVWEAVAAHRSSRRK